MRSKALICIAIIICNAVSSPCQNLKSKEQLQQLWIGYFNQTRLSDKWGIWFDAHLRTKDDFVNDLSQGIARLGLTYYVTDVTKITAGYALMNHFPQDNHKEISQLEHRIWQQIQWHTKYGKKRMMQWIRLEEKFRHKF